MKLTILISTIFFCSVSSHIPDSIFKSISKEISGNENTTVFSTAHVQYLLNGIGFKNCSVAKVQTDSCQLCLGSDALFKWFGYKANASFNKTQLGSLFSGIVFMLTPIKGGIVGAVCNKSIGEKKNFTQDAFNSLLRLYGNGSGSLEEKNIDQLLEDINSTLKFRLTKQPCFDVDDALKGSGLSGAVKDSHDLDKLSSYLLLNLLEGHCIAEHQHKASNLPSAKEFIESLFREYGSNGKISLVKFESLLKKLGIGNETKTTTSNDHSGHDHRKRRSVVLPELESIFAEKPHNRERRSLPPNSNLTGKCFTPENILSIHSVPKASGISETQFKDLCPSLIQQIESGSCKTATATKAVTFKESGWKPWVSAVIAVLLISLGSLIGILLAPFSEEKSFTLILTFLIAVAVSTLLGDAILHLFPHSLGLHKHEEGQDHNHSVTDKNSFVWRCLVFLVGIYFFYLFELYMHSLSKHQHSHGLQETHQHVGNTKKHSIVAGPVEIINERKEKDASLKRDSGLIEAVSGLHKCEEQMCIELEHIDGKTLDTSEVYINSEITNGNKKNHLKDHANGHGTDSNGHAHVVVTKEGPKWKSVAWMVLIGDAIHNFLDGVAIGVAFTDKFPTGFFGGISTSIAILCHELPHELGDFAILIQSGLTIKMALLLNFLSSLTSVIGAIIGVSLGQAMDASSWIFALTAGLFVYIALADMLPELIHSGELRHSPMKTIIIQNVGLFVGFGIMICLAIFEEEIRV